MKPLLRSACVFALLMGLIVPSLFAADKKIVLIAGKVSHGPGDHEFRAGCLLLQSCLNKLPGIVSVVHSNGWPSEATAFDGADAVVIYADGGGGHPAIQGDHTQILAGLAKKGVGLGFMHYGVEVPKDRGGPEFQEWIGGYYEDRYSVNPMWVPQFKNFVNHPVTRGVKPFAVLDEWYFNMRWRPDMKGITQILVDKPSDKVRDGPYVSPRGPYAHIQEAKGREEAMMWVMERPEGGRGFGFTGGHRHVNWANENQRKVVLNAMLWIAKAEVPANGVESNVAPEELAKNLDVKRGVSADAPLVTGTWNVSVDTGTQTGTPVITLVQAGPNLNGHYKGRLGEADFSGTVNLNTREVRWSFDVNFQEQTTTCTYTGKVEDKDLMKGTVKLGDFEGSFTAKR